jgi:hypothetical protein
MTLMNNARRRVPLALATVGASVALAACGSSSSSTSTSTAASNSSGNRAALFACLQQHGVKPPPGAGNGKPPGGGNGGRPPAGAGGGAAGAGSGNSARQAAFKACGATGGHFGQSQSTSSSTTSTK